MVLVTCPNCKKEVSDTAITCPHCGFRLKQPEGKAAIHPTKPGKNSGLGIVSIILGVVGIIVILAVFFSRDKSSSNGLIPPATINQFIEKYAGSYTIEVKGSSGGKYGSI